MTKVATHFRDPQSVTKLRCDALLAAASVAAEAAGPELPPYLDGLVISTQMPGSAPVGRLLVITSGLWVEYQPPVLGVNRVRGVAWAPQPDDAWDIASWFHGRLLALAGDEDLRSFRYDDGPRRAIDPDFNDAPISSFALRASMRPAIL